MHASFNLTKTGQIGIGWIRPLPSVKANAYDLAYYKWLTKIGGGSIRIHDKEIQSTMFRILV